MLPHNFQEDYQMMLGFDVLKTNKMILDFDAKVLKFKNTKNFLEAQNSGKVVKKEEKNNLKSTGVNAEYTDKGKTKE